jgi:hypothetical protein
MEVNLIIGILGMSLILIAFILTEFVKKWNPNTIQFNLINLFGALLLTYYAYTLGSWPFMILNIVWVFVAGYKIVMLER